MAEHQKTIEEAVKAYPDAKWRIVTIHQDIYGSGLDHSDTDGMILRTQLTPVFDANDIVSFSRVMTTPTALSKCSTVTDRLIRTMSSV